ncbi:MAG: hypothetical protein AB7V43_21085, partial [Acidimicrobiia bacterium]
KERVMIDEDRNATYPPRWLLAPSTGERVDADGIPFRGQFQRSLSMSAELELLCAWLDAG